MASIRIVIEFNDMRKILLLSLLIFPQFAFACTLDFAHIVSFSPLLVQFAFIILICKSIIEHMRGKKSVVKLAKFLLPLLLIYMVYAFITTFLGGPICESYGRNAFLESLKFTGFLLSVIGVVMLVIQFRIKNEKTMEKLVTLVAVGVLLFIVVQLCVTYILPDSFFSQRRAPVISAPPIFIVPTS
jgi:hypothetical protein